MATRRRRFGRAAVAAAAVAGVAAAVAFGLPEGRTNARAQTGTTWTTTTVDGCFDPCIMTFRLDTTVSVGALQFRTDYSAASTGFDGSGTDVDCSAQVGDFTTFNDMDAARTLDIAIISIAGFQGPVDVAACALTPCGVPRPDIADFGIFTVDAASPDLGPLLPLPQVSGSIDCAGPTTTLAPDVCGAPESGADPPVTTDVLRVLRAAIGLDTCDPCVCDVDSSGRVDARDARRVLLRTMDLGDPLVCPAC